MLDVRNSFIRTDLKKIIVQSLNKLNQRSKDILHTYHKIYFQNNPRNKKDKRINTLD